MPSTIASFPLLGIVLAIASAAALALGNMMQARGVRRGGTGPFGARQFFALLRNGPWVMGAVLIGAAVLLQLASLTFAPLIVVQPVGVVALVFASLLTARATHTRPSGKEMRAIATSVVGVGAFVTVAALVSTQRTIQDRQLVAILLTLAVVLGVAIVVVIVQRGRPVPAVLIVIAAGVFSGFVATLGKTVILRVQTVLTEGDYRFDSSNLLTLACLVGIAISGGLSIYLVQRAHTVNSPEVVVGGLTVIDPFVAVVLGITILGEATGAPVWSLLLLAAAGAVAVWGVIDLARAQQASARDAPLEG
ncbi:DMT family transporter [Microbacterium sp. NPDC056569]|uniref:DMT family transporter n=1 Tax=Microbacterium sp. NPDC056569 TaxID=3345867 RepID=UPI00366C5DBC